MFVVFADIPWPEGEEALSENSRCVIDKLLNFDPMSRPNTPGISNLFKLHSVYAVPSAV